MPACPTIRIRKTEATMKRLIISSVIILLSLTASAQHDTKFSPEKFEAEMEAYISKEAGLTKQEAAKLFPVFREMHARQRVIYEKMRKQTKDKPADESACKAAIKDYDQMNIELKQLEQSYHKKMMQAVPASKVYDVIKAERRFHRQMMKGWQKGKRH